MIIGQFQLFQYVNCVCAWHPRNLYSPKKDCPLVLQNKIKQSYWRNQGSELVFAGQGFIEKEDGI